MLFKFLSRLLERRDLFRARYETKAVAKRRSSRLPGLEALETRDLLSAALPGLNQTSWLSIGPAPISVAGANTDFAPAQYSAASGPVTAVVADPNDPTGQIYYIGTENGGIWKTTNGGTSWTPLTDFQTDQKGNPIPINVGSLAIARTSSQTLYAGLGVSSLEPDAHPGFGVLKSTNGGATWTLVGNSGTVLAGARISKMAIDPQNPNQAYAAVTQGGSQGPGLYRTLDGGLNWVNILTPASMFANTHLPGAPSGALGAGFALPSVTDVVIDQFNPNNVYVGLGNIGEVATSAAAGVWKTTEATTPGTVTWNQVAGGDDPLIPDNTLPLWDKTVTSVNWQLIGKNIGRVTLALAKNAVGSESILYVLIGNPPPTSVPGNFNDGNAEDDTNNNLPSADKPDSPPSVGTSPLGIFPSGLYKSKDNGLNFTKVMLRDMEYDPGNPLKEHPKDLNLGGLESADFAALTVDPNNSNVVYVGGSRRFTANDPYGSRSHALIRVDTSNMRDTTTQTTDVVHEPGNRIVPNDGDDIDKATCGYLTSNNNAGFGNYKSGASYIGEGVYWYDLEQNTPGPNPSTDRLLPRAVDSLTFDSQGHLLIGSLEGVFRALGPGVNFGYDNTDNGVGIVFTKCPTMATPAPAGLADAVQASIVDLNTNLAIADLTSVAVDPVQEGRFYTTEFNNGSSFSNSNGSGSLTWQVAGNTLTGPNVLIQGSSVNLDMPHGAQIRVGAPDPQNPSASRFVYRTWFFGNGRAAVVERSSDGGQTFITPENKGLSVTQPAQAIPPLAVAPNRIQGVDPTTGAVVFYDELLFGTDRVYLSRTNASEWSVLGPDRPLSAKGGLISSLAFGAPLVERLATVYAGTNAGEVFVNFRDGSGWLNRSAGLPGKSILGITVDPNNPLVAYVAMGDVGGDGKASEVWYTTNGGQTWTNISSNLPQDVTAYAVVFDPRTLPGTPQGRVYVGTDLGVYVTLNNGASWQPLGQGMPHAPVVDLEVDPNNEVLVAGTQGRGVWALSTDLIGPRVASILPTTPGASVSSLDVAFTRDIDPATFTKDDIRRFTDADGNSLLADVNNVQPVPGTFDRVFRITLNTPLTAGGAYTITIGPDISDFTGLKLNQTPDAVGGQDPSDTYTGHFYLTSTANGPFVPVVIGRTLEGGQVFAGYSNGKNRLDTVLFDSWPTGVTWVDVLKGDFNGDGKTDVAARALETGQWWVSLSNGQAGYRTQLWTTWNPNVTWVDVRAGDFNGDGKMDIAGRVLQSGDWWVGVSNGFGFANAKWTNWNPNATWTDVLVGDFNGDGRADIAGRVLQTGQWWVGRSTGFAFVNSLWTTWNPSVTWVDVQVGDFNGDRMADIVGRVLQTGQWWVGLSSGAVFNNTLWATWSTAVTWADVRVGDFNGDGKADIIGRTREGGEWWVGLSNGSSFSTSLWAKWSTAVTWVDVLVGDLNGDGKADIIARTREGGQWWAGLSNGSSAFSTSLWATWSPAVTWVDVLLAEKA